MQRAPTNLCRKPVVGLGNVDRAVLSTDHLIAWNRLALTVLSASNGARLVSYRNTALGGTPVEAVEITPQVAAVVYQPAEEEEGERALRMISTCSNKLLGTAVSLDDTRAGKLICTSRNPTVLAAVGTKVTLLSLGSDEGAVASVDSLPLPSPGRLIAANAAQSLLVVTTDSTCEVFLKGRHVSSTKLSHPKLTVGMAVSSQDEQLLIWTCARSGEVQCNAYLESKNQWQTIPCTDANDEPFAFGFTATDDILLHASGQSLVGIRYDKMTMTSVVEQYSLQSQGTSNSRFFLLVPRKLHNPSATAALQPLAVTTDTSTSGSSAVIIVFDSRQELKRLKLPGSAVVATRDSLTDAASQRISYASPDRLAEERGVVERHEASLQAQVSQLASSRQLEQDTIGALIQESVRLQAAAIALREREVAFADGVELSGAASSQLNERLFSHYLKLQGLRLLSRAPSFQLDWSTALKSKRDQHVVNAVNFGELLLDALHDVVLTPVARLALGGSANLSLCMEVLLGAMGFSSSEPALVDLLERLASDVVGNQGTVVALVFLYLASSASQEAKLDFLGACRASDRLINWGCALYSADVDPSSASLPFAIPQALPDLPGAVGDKLITVAVELLVNAGNFPCAFALHNCVVPANEGGDSAVHQRVAAKIGYVAMTSKQLDLLLGLFMASSEGSNSRKALLSLIVSLCITNNDVSSLPTVVRDESEIALVLRMLQSDSHQRLVVNYLVNLQRFEEALVECARYHPQDEADAHRKSDLEKCLHSMTCAAPPAAPPLPNAIRPMEPSALRRDEFMSSNSNEAASGPVAAGRFAQLFAAGNTSALANSTQSAIPHRHQFGA